MNISREDLGFQTSFRIALEIDQIETRCIFLIKQEL